MDATELSSPSWYLMHFQNFAENRHCRLNDRRASFCNFRSRREKATSPQKHPFPESITQMFHIYEVCGLDDDVRPWRFAVKLTHANWSFVDCCEKRQWFKSAELTACCGNRISVASKNWFIINKQYQ